MKDTNMKTKLTVSLMAALCALALGAQAQDGPPPDGGPGGPGGPGMHRHHPIPPIVRALDVNHDGIIDSNEIANASAELKTLDKNGDGKLTMDELMGPRPHRPGGQDAAEGQGTNEPAGPPGADQEGPGPGGPGGHHHPPMLPLITALDTNHDGIIDADEIANAPAALKTLDKNGDGQLTRDEYLPPRPQHGSGGPGGQDGPPPGGPDDQGGNDGPPGPPPGNDN